MDLTVCIPWENVKAKLQVPQVLYCDINKKSPDGAGFLRNTVINKNLCITVILLK